MKCLKALFYILALLMIASLNSPKSSAQNYIPLNNPLNDIIEKQLLIKNPNFHSSIKPYRIRDIEKYLNLDSLYTSLNINTKSRILNLLLNADTIHSEKIKDFLAADIKFIASAGYGLKNKDTSIQTGIGLNLFGKIGDKFSFNADLLFNNSSYFSFADSMINLTGIVPNKGIAMKTGLGYFYRNLSFYVAYSPSHFFQLEAGKGKNFWGNGYRSLLLSDNSNSYPYLKITSAFWKFKYVNLFAAMRNYENLNPQMPLSNFSDRYTAMHYLSWNITKWLNASFFEAVMFSGRDTSGRRGFDINYLNPVIFYRPVEFSLGSPDNVLMGTNINARILKKNLIYFQLLLDEFVINHVRNRDGWWANKQALQLGFRAFDMFSVKNLSFRSEYNFIRPYTYTHADNFSSFTNCNAPLAHPLGANLKESVSTINYRLKRWQMTMKYNYAVYGSDPGNESYGQNIFKTYLTRPDNREFGNFTGQGIKNSLHYTEINLSYLINPKANLIIEGGIIGRKHKKDGSPDNNNYFLYFSIKTLFENSYFDF